MVLLSVLIYIQYLKTSFGFIISSST